MYIDTHTHTHTYVYRHTHTHTHTHTHGFPDSSVGKKSNVGDPGLIPGLGTSTGEGIGYPLQYSWAFFVA